MKIAYLTSAWDLCIRRWVKLWVAHSKRARKPKLPFSSPPELVHIKGIFNDTAFFREVEGRPFELKEVEAPEYTGIKQVYVDSFLLWQEKHRFRCVYPVFEDQVEWLEHNLNTKTVIEIQPMFMAGDEKPPTYTLGENSPSSSIGNTNDLQAIQPQKPATRLDLQVQALLSIRATLPANATRKQVHAECQRKIPDLFSIGFEGFKKIWNASNKVG